MSFVVNNTTKYGLLDLLCPHTCRGCGRLGTVLCERCKKYTFLRRQAICPICKNLVAKMPEKVANMTTVAKPPQKSLKPPQNLACTKCEMPFVGLWAFGWREGVVKTLIEQYKYQSVRAISDVLAEFLDTALPKELGSDIVVVPLPTIGKHIRERGLDHTLLLAKKFAKRRHWQCRPLLLRAADTVQVGTKVAERETQARQAYGLRQPPKAETKYLLLDDVWTTGASMLAAAEVMQKAGVENLYGVVVGVSKAKTGQLTINLL